MLEAAQYAGMIIYAWWCDVCGRTHRQPTDVCLSCGSPDITKGAAYAAVDYDDVADEKRMDEIRTDRDVSMARGAKLLAELEVNKS